MSDNTSYDEAVQYLKDIGDPTQAGIIDLRIGVVHVRNLCSAIVEKNKQIAELEVLVKVGVYAEKAKDKHIAALRSELADSTKRLHHLESKVREQGKTITTKAEHIRKLEGKAAYWKGAWEEKDLRDNRGKLIEAVKHLVDDLLKWEDGEYYDYDGDYVVDKIVPKAIEVKEMLADSGEED